MAETENTSDRSALETRLAAVEKSLAGIAEAHASNAKMLAGIAASMATQVEALAEILPLVHRAAPLLDSPMAKLAQSPAASVISLWTKGNRRG